MSNWKHKKADELASALVNYSRYAHDHLTDTCLLYGIYKAARSAAIVSETGADALIHIKSVLCYPIKSRHRIGWMP